MPSDQMNGASHGMALSDPQFLYINGRFVPSTAGTTFLVNNPLTGKKIYECCSAGPADYETAIKSAHNAFSKWSQTPPSARRLVLLKAADILESYLMHGGDGVAAADILSAEISATRTWFELNIRASANFLRDSASLATHIKGDIVPADRPGTTILVYREAVGVVFSVCPWNAPINLTTRAVATPLICGNTIVIKPSEISPKSQWLVLHALEEAGLPPGAINFLPTQPSDAAQVTELAVKNPLVRRVNFTGSDRVGTIIAGWAAQVLKHCIFELGGKAPVLVLDSANVQDAVNAVAFGALSNSGQVCMSTERVILQKAIAEEFKETLIQKVATIKCGNLYEDSGVALSGLYSPESAIRVLNLIKGAISQGAKLLSGDLKISGPNQTILKPHILDNVTMEMNISHLETFGPVICLYTASSTTDAIAIANASEFSLCGSVFAADITLALETAKQIRAGTLHVNGPTLYIEAPLPNGGTGGRSGYGRFGGIAGVEEFTERKVVSLASSGLRYSF